MNHSYSDRYAKERPLKFERPFFIFACVFLFLFYAFHHGPDTVLFSLGKELLLREVIEVFECNFLNGGFAACVRVEATVVKTYPVEPVLVVAYIDVILFGVASFTREKSSSFAPFFRRPIHSSYARLIITS